LIGKRFNGYDMLSELDRSRFDIKLMVIDKNSDNNEVVNLLDKRSLLNMYHHMIEFETKTLSIHSNLSITSPALINSTEYKNCDIVHFHMFHNTRLSIFSLLKISREKKVIITLHDPWFLTGRCVHFYECEKWKSGCVNCPDLSTLFPFSEDNCHKNWKLKKTIFDQIDAAIIVSSQWMYDLVKSSPVFEHQKKIHIIPFSVDADIFKEKFAKNKVRKHFKIPVNDVVLFLRAQNEFKGTEYIVEALKILNTDKSITILTCDNKGLLKDIEEKFNIVELGLIHDDEMIKAFNCCDIFLMPSKGESFGMMAIEAMACSRPVIIFNNTALPSITFAPECGVVANNRDPVDLCNKIEFLLNNPEECTRRGRLGRKLVEENYCKDDYNKKIEHLYNITAKKEKIDKNDTIIEGDLCSSETKKIMCILNDFSKKYLKEENYLKLRYNVESVDKSDIDFSSVEVQNIIDQYCNNIYNLLISENESAVKIYRGKIKSIIQSNKVLHHIAKIPMKIFNSINL